MTKALLRNTFREIQYTKARFISIMAIIALGVGFFAGIKATSPSMYNLAETYYRESRLMDFRLVSTAGFAEEDIEAVAALEGVESVMPSYFCDAIVQSDDGGEVGKHILGRRLPFDKLHREIRMRPADTCRVDMDDVRVVESRNGFRLVEELRATRTDVNHFDRNPSRERDLLREVDAPHAAASEQTFETIVGAAKIRQGIRFGAEQRPAKGV